MVGNPHLGIISGCPSADQDQDTPLPDASECVCSRQLSLCILEQHDLFEYVARFDPASGVKITDIPEECTDRVKAVHTVVHH